MKFNKFYKEVLTAAMQNSTCARMHVAAIIVKNGRIINSGWNGAMPKKEHCCEHFKDVDKTSPKFYADHHEWSNRHEGHAEASAIATAAKYGIPIDGWEIACTHTPCLSCAKLIITAGLTKLYYLEKYDRDLSGFQLLQENGIECLQL